MLLPNTSFAWGRRFGGARSRLATRCVSRICRRGVSGAVGAGVGLLALSAPAGALATGVPAAAAVHAHLVTARPEAGSPVRSVPLRVEHPAQYAGDKAAANRRYGGWVAAHSSVFGPGLSIASAIPALSKSGLVAAGAGGATPPDTTGAIGPSSYLELVNSQIAVYSRATLASPPLATAAEDTFVGRSSTCDGQIKWDNPARRFEYYSLDCAAPRGSEGFSFGWSKTSSPTPLTGSAANWCRYHVSTGSNLEDYGKLGNDNSFLIVGSNEFNDRSGIYEDSPIFTIPKPANGSTTCPSETLTKFIPTPAGTDFTPQPANVFQSSAKGFIASLSDSSHLHMFTVSGTTTPTLTDNGTVAVTTFATPAGVPQPGSSDQLDSSDTRLTQAVATIDPQLRAFAVWTQHTVAGAAGGPSVVRWYELKAGVSAPAPVQTGTVAVAGAFAFNGAISPTAQGNAAAIDYDVGSSTLRVQVRARDHLPGSAPGSTANETTLASSQGIDADFSCPSQNGHTSSSCRWGDYAGASPDPNCAAQVWGTNELNGATNPGTATWASQNFRLQLDECPTAAFAITPTSPAHGSPVTFDGSGSSDIDGSVSSYKWSFGDGVSSTVTTTTTNHTYAAAGTYHVTLTITDTTGLTATVAQNVTVG